MEYHNHESLTRLIWVSFTSKEKHKMALLLQCRLLRGIYTHLRQCRSLSLTTFQGHSAVALETSICATVQTAGSQGQHSAHRAWVSTVSTTFPATVYLEYKPLFTYVIILITQISKTYRTEGLIFSISVSINWTNLNHNYERIISNCLNFSYTSDYVCSSMVIIRSTISD